MSNKRINKLIFLGNYNTTEILSGPEKVAKRIFSEYIRENNSIFYTYFQDGKKYGYREKIFGYKTIKNIDESKVIMIGLIRLLIQLIKTKPQIIHIITQNRFTLIAYLYKFIKSRVKIIFNFHGILKYQYIDNSFDKNFTYAKDMFFERIALKYSDKLIVPSELTVNQIKKYYKITMNKIVIISNGIDNIFFEREILIGNNNTKFIPKIIYLLDTDNYLLKGYYLFLKIIENLNFYAEIYVIGDREITIKNNNILLITIKKMNTNNYKRFLIDKNIYLSTSHFESFSIICIEAAALGLIPIISKNIGSASLFLNNFNSFILDLDYREYIEAIVTIKNYYNQLKINLLNMNLIDLKWEKIFLQYKKLYNEII